MADLIIRDGRVLEEDIDMDDHESVEGNVLAVV